GRCRRCRPGRACDPAAGPRRTAARVPGCCAAAARSGSSLREPLSGASLPGFRLLCNPFRTRGGKTCRVPQRANPREHCHRSLRRGIMKAGNDAPTRTSTPASRRLPWHTTTETRSMSLKEQALRTIEKLPDDASLDELIDRLYLTYKVERGIAQAEAGEGSSHEDAHKRLAQWLE